MADNTPIEWTDATWNPITGCSVVSPGCTNCYAMRLAGTRLKHTASRKGLTTPSKAGPVWNGQVRLNEPMLRWPISWRGSKAAKAEDRPSRIFVCAHGDLFHESVPDAWIDQVFAVMALSPQHTFQVLTKRAERMRAYMERLSKGWVLRLSAAINVMGPEAIKAADAPGRPAPAWPLPNVWLGVSAENQHWLMQRATQLMETPAAVRFLSAEPLLNPLDITPFVLPVKDWPNSWLNDYPFIFPKHRLDWIIVGGESGPGARPMHPAWARQIRDACAAAGVPFFFKQWGAWTPGENAGPVRGPQTGAWLYDSGWSYTAFSRAGAEDLTADDEPDVWRVGKKVAGRLLDGVEHNLMPGTRA